jgi:hypothetical protein
MKNLFRLLIWRSALWLTRRGCFKAGGAWYRYFCHTYNDAWENERTVEVPLVVKPLRAAQRRGQSILEVGCVLPHYMKADWTVVDKFERWPGVLNVDIADFMATGHTFDLIVSISTFEHVGFDEDLRARRERSADADKLRDVILGLRDHCLAAGGRLVATVPIGYNPALDVLLFEGALPFETCRFLVRWSRYNLWKEVPAAEARGVAYGAPYSCANAICLFSLCKPG